VDFTNKDNPLTNLGVLFSANQILVFADCDVDLRWLFQIKMVMILAMIFGAHLLPYGCFINQEVTRFYQLLFQLSL